MKTGDQEKKVLNKLTILCWATFIAILGHMQPVGHRLDTPMPDTHFQRLCLNQSGMGPENPFPVRVSQVILMCGQDREAPLHTAQHELIAQFPYHLALFQT